MRKTLFIIVLLGIAGCDESPASTWQQFADGGMLNVGMPDQASDGAVFFVDGNTGHGDIYESRSRDQPPIQLTWEEVFEGDPCLSLAGDCVYFTRETGGGAAIWRVDRKTLAEKQITTENVLVHDTAVTELNGRTSLLVMRTSRSGTDFVEVAIDSGQQLRSFGQLAVASSSGQFVLNAVEKGLILHDLASDREHAISPNWIAWPLAVSKSGKFAVVRRYTEPWQFDGELYLLDIQTGKFLPIGQGHSAVVDEENEAVLFASGYQGDLSVFDQKKGTAELLRLSPVYRTHLREVRDGVVFASISDRRGLSYKVSKFDFDSRQVVDIAQVGP